MRSLISVIGWSIVLSLGTAVAPYGAYAKAAAATCRSVPLGFPEKRDFLTYDEQLREIFVSHKTEITVVSLENGKVIGNVRGVNGSHGIAVVRTSGRGYADAAATRTVVVFDSKTLKTLKTIPVGVDPDAVIYDPYDRRLFVMDGDGQALTAIDARRDVAISTIPLGGSPEFAAVDGRGKLFVNIASKGEMVRLDARSLGIEARWMLAGCERPHGLAIDPINARLFASCENGKLVVVRADNGRVIATLPIGLGSDGVAYDPKHHLVYSSNKDGTLSVIAEKGPDRFVAQTPIRTVRNASTIALDPATGRVFLGVGGTDASAPPTKRIGASLLILDHPYAATTNTHCNSSIHAPGSD